MLQSPKECIDRSEKSLPEYLKGTPNYAGFREALCECASNTDVFNLLDRSLQDAHHFSSKSNL